MPYSNKFSQLYKSVPIVYHHISYLILGAVIGLNLTQAMLLLNLKAHSYIPLLPVGLLLLLSQLKRKSPLTSSIYKKISALCLLNCAVLLLMIVIL